MWGDQVMKRREKYGKRQSRRKGEYKKVREEEGRREEGKEG